MKRITLAVLVVLLGACSAGPRPGGVSIPDHAALEAALRAHVAELADDSYAGRMPGTQGEAKTLRYLASQWQDAGLESGTNDPANPWFAPVELSTSTPDGSTAVFHAKGRRIVLGDADIHLFTSARRVLFDKAPVIYVGHRDAQPEVSEVAGQVVLMPWERGARREQREDLLNQGAAAVIAIVDNSAELADLAAHRSRGTYQLADENAASSIDGFITRAATEKLLGAERLAEWTDAADPRPRAVPLEVSLEATSRAGAVRTHNLIARIPGRDPSAGVVLLLAHWDHFGICAPEGEADRICNGAIDNASGLAVLTELVRLLAAGPAMERDVYVLATTAEEWGLLGARAFAQEPPIPLDTIVAAFNIDMMGIARKGAPVAVIGRGMTGLDAAVDAVIAASGRREGDREMAARFVRRQDGWALLQRDVPALSISATFAESGPLQRYLDGDYHRPGDEPDRVELGGAVDDLLLHLALVRHFANPQLWPHGRPAGTESGSPARR